MKGNYDEMSTLSLLRTLFSGYIWAGIVLLLIADLIHVSFSQTSYSLLIFNDLIETVGISIIVASIFSFASGTSEFARKIKNLLHEIIISKEFLKTIDEKEKRDALGLILGTSKKDDLSYLQREEYYRFFIDEALGISQKSVRSHYCCRNRIYIDESKSIRSEVTISYTLFPSSNGDFGNVICKLEGSDPTLAKYESITLKTPSGNILDFTDNDLQQGKLAINEILNAKLKSNTLESIPSFLDIDIQLSDTGYDHWILVGCKLGKPTHKFEFYLICEDNLEIRECSIFLFGAEPSKTQSSKELRITHNQWMAESTGVEVLVAIPHAYEP